MSAKGVAAAAVVALAVGAIGYGLGQGQTTANGARTPAGRRADEGVRGPAGEGPEPAPPRPGSGSGSGDSAAPGTADPRPRKPETDDQRRARHRAAAGQYRDALQIPPAVQEAAKKLGVDERIVRSVMMAQWHLLAERQSPGPVQRESAAEALRELSSLGETGFLAVIAMVRGSPFGADYKRLVEATWQPGREQKLFDAIDEAIREGATPFGPMAALGAADTDDVRRFLRDRLARHRNHASLFAAAASALGELHDAESAVKVAANLSREGWSGLRPTLLTALGGMGGDDARRALVEYLSWKHATVEATALHALARIDPARARAEAEALLAGWRDNTLDAVQRSRVRAFLDQLR